MPDRAYTDAELDAAIAAITDPQRLREAQELVDAGRAVAAARARAARSPRAAGSTRRTSRRFARPPAGKMPNERLRAVRTLLAEETRLGMLVGVAVGFELARELGSRANAPTTQED